MRKKKDTILLTDEPQLISDSAPFEYVEAFKELRTNLNFAVSNKHGDRKCSKLVVTSSIPNEGKSTIAANLAISLSQEGKRVLLIDADMRNPVLRKYLDLQQEAPTGLSALLNNDVKINECLIRTSYGMDVIADGPIPPNPAELIKSDAMQSLLKGTEAYYDYIIFDTPPVGVITDAAALSSLCDGVVYVVRHKFAGKADVRSAVKKLKMVDAKILGVVLTQYEIPQNGGKYGHYHRYNKYDR